MHISKPFGRKDAYDSVLARTYTRVMINASGGVLQGGMSCAHLVDVLSQQGGLRESHDAQTPGPQTNISGVKRMDGGARAEEWGVAAYRGRAVPEYVGFKTSTHTRAAVVDPWQRSSREGGTDRLSWRLGYRVLQAMMFLSTPLGRRSSNDLPPSMLRASGGAAGLPLAPFFGRRRKALFGSLMGHGKVGMSEEGKG